MRRTTIVSISVNVKGGVDEQMRFAEYLTKWLVGMVAGWVDPTVVNNVILGHRDLNPGKDCPGYKDVAKEYADIQPK